MPPEQCRDRSRSPPPDGTKTDKHPGFSATPLHPHVGARIEGVDLATVDEAFITRELAPALERYGLLLFANQAHTTPQQQFDFICKFPDIDTEDVKQQINPFAKNDPSCIPELPAVRALGTSKDEQLRRGALPEENYIGKEWHTDGQGITGLFAAQVPSKDAPARRTTLWANSARAWDLLDETLRTQAIEMKARIGPRYTMEASIGAMAKHGAVTSENGLRLLRGIEDDKLADEQKVLRESPHPHPRRWEQFWGSPVRRNPFTNKYVLWTLPVHLEGCEGMEREQALDLMERILSPGTNDENVYSHEWTTGDFVLWDNRCTLHSTTKIVEEPQLMYQAFVRTKTPMLPAE